MMYGYGPGWPWMMLMMLLWIALIAVIVWAVIGLVQCSGGGEHGRQGRETPQEILDRRFALGEIDADEYRQARAHLAGREPGSS
ncbi:SHOCT domain-containing protein [Micromonospora sp. MS34]|uniref:SHOCT domain-containing protein n=1 Tax=Micromonospora sp. MS34 TaxID=3385971 RepID=UPI0039A15BA3